jgi:hypothetical protein
MTFLLEEKIRKLSREVLALPDQREAPPIEIWLGMREIDNVRRGIRERLVDYLLRHTRLLPRDLIILGNELCDEVRRSEGAGRVDEERIRRLVADCSYSFGVEQLAIVANHVASDLMPGSAGRLGYSEIYTEHAEYRNEVLERILEVIAVIPHDRFSNDLLRIAMARAKEVFEGYDGLFSVLWQAGLVGYRGVRERSRWDVFYASDGRSPFQIPLGAAEYVFHSCMIDAAGVDAPCVSEPVCTE